MAGIITDFEAERAFATTSAVVFASTTTFGPRVTKYANLPSGGPDVPECSTLIYQGGDDGSAVAFAFDPYFKHSVDPDSPACLADQFTSYWQQGADVATVTSLGPRFACPSQYYGAENDVGDGTTQIFCCPS